MLLIVITLSFAAVSFGAETTTECPMMKEQNQRSNPKANMAALKPKPKIKSESSAQ